jgi:hypothetical protein
METEIKKRTYHRYTKEEVMNFAAFMGQGKERTCQEVARFLADNGIINNYEVYDQLTHNRVSRYICDVVREMLGKNSITTKKTHGQFKGTYTMTISQEEVINRLGYNNSPEVEEKNQEKEETQKDETEINRKPGLVSLIHKLLHFFENIQTYSPREFENLLKEVSDNEFNNRKVIEVVISSFKESEQQKLSEIEQKFLS